MEETWIFLDTHSHSPAYPYIKKCHRYHQHKDSTHRSPLSGGANESKVRRLLRRHFVSPVSAGRVSPHPTSALERHTGDEDRGRRHSDAADVMVGTGGHRERHQVLLLGKWTAYLLL